MKHSYCVACGSSDRLHQHHLIPGSDHPSNQITLCAPCHAKIHGLDITASTLAQLSNEHNAQEAARAAKFAATIQPHITSILQKRPSATYQYICDQLNHNGLRTSTNKHWTTASLYKLMNRLSIHKSHADNRGRKSQPTSILSTTAQIYAKHQTAYIRWCRNHDYAPVPIQPAQLVEFIEQFSGTRQHLNYALSSISLLHRERGYPKPTLASEVKTARKAKRF